MSKNFPGQPTGPSRFYGFSTGAGSGGLATGGSDFQPRIKHCSGIGRAGDCINQSSELRFQHWCGSRPDTNRTNAALTHLRPSVIGKAAFDPDRCAAPPLWPIRWLPSSDICTRSLTLSHLTG
jgi:hypothetical protein